MLGRQGSPTKGIQVFFIGEIKGSKRETPLLMDMVIGKSGEKVDSAGLKPATLGLYPNALPTELRAQLTELPLTVPYIGISLTHTGGRVGSYIRDSQWQFSQLGS